MPRACLAILFVLPLAFCGDLRAAPGLKILPDKVVLTGSKSSQRVLVFRLENGEVVGDSTALAMLSSSNPAVAAVAPDGTITAVGNGDAVITATCLQQQATAAVHVTGATETPANTFRNHVIPMMTKLGCNSGACHGALAGKGGLKLSLRGYAPLADYFALTRQTLGRRVDTVEPSQSLLLQKPTLAMPHGGGQKIELGSSDFQVLANWIAAGAPAPQPTDSAIERLEVFPPSAILKPKDSLQILVRAWYSDGRSEDVTHWAKFSSTEDLVATVDQEGKIRVSGHGETAVSVWFSNLVATTRIASPFPHQIDGKAFAAAARSNSIDALVLKKLESLHIPPSPPCTDREFIRRTYLDAAGILPTPEEVNKFLGDSAPDKRAKLVDRLLERPEFVDYWAYKWSDLLLLSTRKLSQPAMWSFYQFIRQSVADNKPWDRFAREIVTANGSTLQNGAANYFVLHKDVTDITESTSVTFLGMSITCCRCHNHPLEKWTQDQYWSMANLFSRVALKNGEGGGEVHVQELPVGDILHPRSGLAMPPTPLDAKPLAVVSRNSRRQFFADWLTAPENPYFAKAVVNRVWRNFLGRGLVEAEDDLRQTNPPTNQELFDSVARDFVATGYDVKRLIRSIMNSATYQRSATPLPQNVNDDRFYSHYILRRLSAEVILDAYTQISRVPGSFAIYFDARPVFSFPAGTRAQQLPDVRIASDFLDSFGRPDRTQPCACERQQDSSVSQALHLNNGKTLNDKLRAKESLIERWLVDKITDDEAVRQLFVMALSREPLPAELKKFHVLLAEAATDKTMTRREALQDLFWAVLTGREFLFNH